MTTSTQNKIQALILDVAGTCLDYGSCAPVYAFQQVFRNHGVEVSSEEVRVPMGAQKREHIRQMLANQPAIAERWKNMHYGADYTGSDIDQMYSELETLSLSAIQQCSIPIPGVIPALLSVKEKYNLCLALTTGYNDNMLNTALVTAEQSDAFVTRLQFDAIISSSDVSLGRPAPYMLYKAMEKMGIINPISCVAIGDTVLDIQAAIHANMWAVGVAKSGNLIGCSSEKEFMALPAEERAIRLLTSRKILEKAGADYIIDSVADIEEAIEYIHFELDS